MSKYVRLTALCAALAVCASVTPTLALTQNDGTAEGRSACTPDVFRLCRAQIPNVDAIVACLKSNKQNLSPACRATMFSGKK
jgi:Trk K+ transport system NAD-binding subunit